MYAQVWDIWSRIIYSDTNSLSSAKLFILEVIENTMRGPKKLDQQI